MKVNVGCQVEVELLSRSAEAEQLAFRMVSDQQADFAHGLLGESTPLAKAILDQPEGSVVPYSMADIYAVRILSVTPGQADAESDAAERRRAEAEDAARQAGRTSAIVFASSFSGKWGDYDPSGIEKWEEEEDSGSDISGEA